MLLVYVGMLPLALSLILRFIPGRRARESCAVIFSFLVSGAIGYALIRGGDTGMKLNWFSAGEERIELFRLSQNFICALRLDEAGKIYLGLASLLWPWATLYAVEYMRHEPRKGHFFSWFLLAYSAVVFLAAAENLFTLYIFYELLTLCTVPLVWHKRDEDSNKAALTYLLYLIGGAALGFIAVLLVPVFMEADGAFCLGGTNGYAQGTHLDPRCAWIAMLGFLGFGVKAAVLPFCRWLPKASVAPTPVTALLHAVAVVNAGVFAVVRVLYYTVSCDMLRGSPMQYVQPMMVVLCAATLLYAAAMAVREQQVKRRLAWSTVSNLSYMLFGLSLASSQGMTAGLAHMIFHSLAKIILFFCAGAVLTQTGRTQVRQMRGLGRKMPFTFGVFTLAGLSLVGVPPFPGFIGKYLLVTAAFDSRGASPVSGGPFAVTGAVALMAASVLTVIYIFTVIFPAFFMKYQEEPGETPPRDPGLCMKIALGALSLLLIAASVFADPILRFLHTLAGGGIA